MRLAHAHGPRVAPPVGQVNLPLRSGSVMRFPKLVVFDLDACLWSPEMFELAARPTSYDAKAGGVIAGRDV